MEKADQICIELIVNLAKRLSFLCEEDQTLQAFYIARVDQDIKHVTLQEITIPTNTDFPPGSSEEIARIEQLLREDKTCQDLCGTLHNLDIGNFTLTAFSFRLKRQQDPTTNAFCKQMESLMAREK